MKRTVSILLVLLAALMLLTACGKSTETPAADGPGFSSVTRPTSPPADTPEPTQQPTQEPTEEPTEEPSAEPGAFPGGLDDDGRGPEEDEPQGEYVELTAALQRKLNLFLSNFAEQFFSFFSYEEQDAPVRAVDFAHIWCKINDRNRIFYETVDGEPYEVLTMSEADDVVSRYFPMLISDYDMEHLYPERNYSFYRDGSFYYMAADGEAHNLIAVANGFMRRDDGTYTVSFSVYEVDLDEYFDQGIADWYYDMSAIDASNSASLTLVSTGAAKVTEGKWNGTDVFKLLAYQTQAAGY